MIQIGDFTASTGWINRFKSLHGIVYCQICGESELVNEEDSVTRKNNLPNLLKDCWLQDVFNADEFGLFFKVMLKKSLVYEKEKVIVAKKVKKDLRFY